MPESGGQDGVLFSDWVGDGGTEDSASGSWVLVSPRVSWEFEGTSDDM